jgi:hypothetical protein
MDQRIFVCERELEAFLAFLIEASHKGVRGPLHRAQPTETFVPFQDLEDYFSTPLQLKKTLESVCRRFPWTNIRSWIPPNYFRVFAILLRIGKGTYITHFHSHGLSDALLPFEKCPPDFPKADPDKQFFSNFLSTQWEFCAPDFRYKQLNRRVFRNHGWILPITQKTSLGGGGSATLFKIQLHPSYDHLVQPTPGRRPVSVLSEIPKHSLSRDLIRL